MTSRSRLDRLGLAGFGRVSFVAVCASLAMGSWAVSPALAASYSFTCTVAPQTWCYSPAVPTEDYYEIVVASPSGTSYDMTAAAELYEPAQSNWVTLGAGNTCATCSVGTTIETFDYIYDYISTRPQVFNDATSNSRTFTVTAYF